MERVGVIAVWTIACLIRTVQSCSVNVGHGAEAEALLEFKGSLSGNVSTLANWDVGKTPCDWDLIGCDGDGYVSAIYLGGVGIGGSIDEIPVTKLPRLVHLDLSYNTFGGSIPEAFQYISFTRLVLNNNQISGNIPCSLGSIHGISYTLQLQNNKLEGCVPEHLVNKNYFRGNNLAGICPTCPSEIGDRCCPKLV